MRTTERRRLGEQRSGRRVAVVEANRVGRGATTHSTVTMTVGHGRLYSKIEDEHGFDAAAAYAQANVAGFEEILDLALTLQIDCMLRRHRVPSTARPG